MNFVFVEPILGFKLFSGVAYDDKRQRHDAVRKLAVPRKSGHVPVHRIDARPYRPQAERVGGDEQILCGGCAVLHPESRNDELSRVGADKYAESARVTMRANGLNAGIASSIARSLMTINSHGCSLAADGALIAAASSFRIVSSSTSSLV